MVGIFIVGCCNHTFLLIIPLIFLCSNFDDRHVSTREQITLQDTLDGTGYSTSQFGLDGNSSTKNFSP